LGPPEGAEAHTVHKVQLKRARLVVLHGFSLLNNNGAPLTEFLKSAGPFFLEIEIEKRDPFGQSLV
jgi:hypothetical protein